MRAVRVLLFAVAAMCSAVSVDLARIVLHSTTSEIRGVAHDAAGNIYVSGMLRDGEFQPVRPLQTDGGLFLMKLSGSGAVLLATPLGTQRHRDQFGGIAVDAQGNVWIAGTTRAPDLAITSGATAIHGDQDHVFVICLPPSVDRISFST